MESHLADVLADQSAAWNRGDIEAFMSHYWKSDDLTFSAGGKTTHGWDPTLQRYRMRYPTTEQMGRLEFKIECVRPLGPRAALLLGRWQLTRDGDSFGGNFSLVFQRINGRWVIVHDHTSTDDPFESLRQQTRVPLPGSAKLCFALR
jgi:beta-aspartyl-peptidase (threonine type)